MEVIESIKTYKLLPISVSKDISRRAKFKSSEKGLGSSKGIAASTNNDKVSLITIPKK